MTILYAISVISFCALVWAAFAISRHIRMASKSTPIQTANPESKPRKAS